MAYQKDATGIRQTANNVASTIVVAETAAGILKSHDTILERFQALRDEVFTDLDVRRTEDNAMFLEQEAKAPAKPAKSGGKRSGGKPSSDIDNPGDVVINNGAFKTLTVAAVYDMPASEAGDYGYPKAEPGTKTGKDYIKWLTTNDKNPFMQKVATQFLESKRASSDAE
jgi:hypothetical protein